MEVRQRHDPGSCQPLKYAVMKHNLTIEKVSLLLILVITGITACVKDACKREHTYTYYEAVYKTKDEVRANIKSNTSRPIETPGKIYIRGNYVFLNEVDRGIHVIDNSNPSAPKPVSFIDIPGNLDMAVKGNILYADLYTDLVALDITDPVHAKLTKIVEGVFPYRVYGNGFVRSVSNDMIITDWVRRDTVLRESCDQPNWFRSWGRADVFMTTVNSSQSGAASSPIGTGGSMARFAILNERLYTVSISELEVFNITDSRNPGHTNTVSIGWNIETIYPFRDKLFIGSTSGMFIYHASNPDAPSLAGQFSHVSSCDPVVADDNYAYVTLRSGTECQGFTNQLEIVKLNNLTDPTLEKTYPMKNPHGLSKDADLLFICDGAAGLKVYNASDVKNLRLLDEVKDLDTYDVIAMNGIALISARDGLYQYSYADPENLKLLSRLVLEKK